MQKAVFKPRARLILQLGDQLIRNESIALLELVKNSYDADATDVDITMRRLDQPDDGVIRIRDNGVGMDAEIIRNVWMEPGSEWKEKQVKRLVRAGRRTAGLCRIPLGEKGIGRFAAHKLGSEIRLVSRKKRCDEVVVQIDWDSFSKPGYLEDVPVHIEERRPKVFTKGRTGTSITIKRLKETWTRRLVRELSRAVNSLCSPFGGPDSFDVTLDVDNADWLKGLLSWEDIKGHALYSFKARVEADQIKHFTYRFVPWATMKRLKQRRLTETDEEIAKMRRMVDGDGEPIDLSDFRIGPFEFRGFIFDRESKILSLGVTDKKGFKEYLDVNGGVRVYRDGVRIYDYGEPGNDWLNLGIRRINVPTKRISNNLIIAAVHLQRDSSGDLVEKTNREGFIEDEAYEVFKGAVMYVLNQVETLRNTDKDRMRTFYGPTHRSEPVLSDLGELRSLIEKKVKNKELRTEALKYLKRVENDYKFISETLLRSAGAGLSLSVVIHEIEKIIKELTRIVKREPVSRRIITIVRHLSELIEGYSVIVSKTETRTQSLKVIIDQALFDIEFRLKAHKVKVTRHHLDSEGPSRVRCARNLITGTILNIIDNSIWWFNYARIAQRKIHISISDELPGFLCIVIADNGPGFSLPTEEITKPFVTNKPDGMGLGLHIAKEVMEAHGGQLLFPDWEEFQLPAVYRQGALVALCFKKRRKGD